LRRSIQPPDDAASQETNGCERNGCRHDRAEDDLAEAIPEVDPRTVASDDGSERRFGAELSAD
jgi:hypothetical protein